MAASAQESKKVVEGIFAINKPQWASSAGVLRDLQNAFSTSQLFAPWLTHNRRKMILAQTRKKHIDNLRVKLGHGGTLDPLATGVLIVGVGKGTKCLQRFLECTKSYECVLVFGAATDSYDSTGKVVSRASYAHVTRELVESKLAAFRGKIMQKPSIFSALKVDGKKMYEYARAGGDVPEVPARPVEVEELEIVEWLESGTHSYTLPKEEMDSTQQEGAKNLLGIRKEDADVAARRNKKRGRSQSPNGLQTKRPRTVDELEPNAKVSEPSIDPDDHVLGAEDHPRAPTTPDEPAMSGALPVEDPSESEQKPSEPQPQPPAVRLRMTVTSGFYVRSLCHDLGVACDSLGLMASLNRSRQGDYELGKNVLEYTDLEAGQQVWEPKVRQFLEDFMEKEGWEADEVLDDDETWQAKNKNSWVQRKEGDRDRSFRGGQKGGWRGRGGKGWHQKR